MKLSKAKQFYKKIENEGLSSSNNLEIFRKVNYELLKAVNLIAQKVKGDETDSVRQRNFTKSLVIIYTIQTSLDFEKEQISWVDFFRFYEFCRKKIISGVTYRNYKDLEKIAVNIDKLFNFNFFKSLEA